MITYPQPFKKVSILKDVDDICPNDAPCNINKLEALLFYICYLLIVGVCNAYRNERHI